MNEVIHLKSVVPGDVIALLRNRAEATLRGIYEDYFEDKSFDEFIRDHLGHTSVVMKIANYRFTTGDMFLQLKDCLQPHAERVFGVSELLIHPISYLRFSFPGIYYSDEHKVAFLDSQPHYDRSYGIEAFTFWLALDDIDDESGGLCSFSGPETLEYFPLEGQNRFSYKGYWDAAKDIDPMIRRETITYPVRPGDVLTFDSTVLHGGTKPRTRRRVSFDFRLVPVANLKEAPASVLRIFDEVNTRLDLCNANNLILIGDFIGASRILDQRESGTSNRELMAVASALRCRPPDPSVVQEHAEMAWRNEYGWLTH